MFTLLACSLYHAEYVSENEASRITFIGMGEFLHSPHGLQVQDANSSAPVFTLKDADFIKMNPLYGESEPTRNLSEIAASLFNAVVSVITLLF